MHSQNSFITLTYNNENLPDDYSISKPVLQKFFKRLRKYTGAKLRYFACGEYGEKNNRPHYHAIIFGYDFPDKQLYTKTANGDLLFRSPLLEKAWPYGFSTIGEATFESAAYVARYVMKKRKGDDDHKDKHGKTNKEHYQLVDSDSGEIFNISPEFCLMSRRPGIGRQWLETFKTDTDKDFITVRGKKMSLPKYYDNLLEEYHQEDMKERKWIRMSKVDKKDNTYERLHVKETVKIAQTQTLTRGLENNET